MVNLFFYQHFYEVFNLQALFKISRAILKLILWRKACFLCLNKQTLNRGASWQFLLQIQD